MNATTPTEAPPAAELLAGLASFAAADDLSVGKDGFNPHFNYGYMTEQALFTAARAALSEAGLSGTISFEAGQHEIVPTWNKDGQERPGILATITAVLTVRDQQGNSVECRAFGQGLDNADKAYYKAMTGAAKYVVQKALMIAVEGAEDTDASTGGSVAGRSSGGVASDKQLGFLCSLVKKGHYVESTSSSDVEWMALRLARMQAGDAALNEFVKITKSAASELIEKLQVIPEHRVAEVLEKLAQWEGEHGRPQAAGEPRADTPAAGQPDEPVAATAKPSDDDDIPF